MKLSVEPRKRDVQVPEELTNRIQAQLKDAGYSSVEELVLSLLNEWVVRQESLGNDSGERISASDEATITERLKSLGYV